MARQSMDERRPGGADQEMVVSVDQRLVAALGSLVLLALVGMGVWMAMRRGASGPATRAGSGAPVAAPDLAATATAEVVVGMIAAGIDPSKAGGVAQVERIGTQAPPAGGPGVIASSAPPMVQTAVSETGAGNVTEFERPEGAPDACSWPHDVLHGFPDPNVDNPGYSPERIEAVTSVLKGPRLAIGDLNDIFSYDYGVVPGDEVAKHDFRLKNVGDEDLKISRVYTGCGCTATRIKDTVLDGAGFVRPVPLTLKPGEETTFSVEYDPRVEEGSPCRARGKFVQIFSNDRTKTAFDPAVQDQYEVRFRIVIEPRYGVTREQIATQEAVAEATKAAKKKDTSSSP